MPSLRQVTPTSTPVHAWTEQDGGRTESLTRRVSSLASLVETKWSDIQVARQGKYSIERLESLDQYCKSTSMPHVILVCVLTPLPALATTLLLELLPLQPPSEGWAANWIFWIRITAMSFMATATGMLTLRRLVLGLHFTFKKVFIMAGGIVTGFVGFSILFAVLIGFPVPFVMLLCGIPNITVIGLMVVLTLGTAPFRHSSPCRRHLLKFHSFFNAHETLATIYPLCKVLYELVPDNYHGFTMLLLPLWKFGATKYIGRTVHEMEDYIPAIVAFSVDYFSTLFVTVCMFNSQSILVSVLTILTDVFLSVLEFRELRTNANAVFHLLQGQQSNESQNLLELMLTIARNPDVHGLTALPDVRLWACEPHLLSTERLEMLKKLKALDVYNSRSQSSTHERPSALITPEEGRHKQPARRVFVAPSSSGPVIESLEKIPAAKCNQNTSSIRSLKNADSSKKLVVQGLQLLFHCEYITLVEYIECVIPIVFLTYKSVLQLLPNVVYSPGGATAWHIGTVGNILLFSVLEVFSLLALNTLLRRKFTFSPLHQLAYVLETQIELVQTGLFIATVVFFAVRARTLWHGFQSSLRMASQVEIPVHCFDTCFGTIRKLIRRSQLLQHL